jgi:hypothetical protein
MNSPLESKPNSRIHLTRWAVTALAEKHRRSDHRPGLPVPRRHQPAGDANVMWQDWPSCSPMAGAST